ncbi:hypothetical protein [Klebsiella pneumoniae]|uniref:hypothetical protein n=1 Tax=Klebsiella pneumoniae TaxID=573 RepID=UPI002244813E|nr:hypothetical protein [Klebsiella pneumoniae]
MKLITRIAFATLLTTGFSITAQAADVKAAPAPAQDPIVQHLKLTNDQLAAFSKIDQQVRYYRVKYYFEVNKVLTPEQRTQVKKDLADALSE